MAAGRARRFGSTYVGAPPVNDDVVDKESSPNWNNVKERQFLPQNNDPRFGNSTRIGVHATVWRLQPDNRFALMYSGMRNPYDFAYNLAGEGFTFDSDMEWDVNAPWYRENRTVHLIPGGDSGYRNGTGTFFSTEDWKPAGPGIRGHGQRILNARFTPGGRWRPRAQTAPCSSGTCRAAGRSARRWSCSATIWRSSPAS